MKTYTLVHIDGSESSRSWDSIIALLEDMNPEHCERYEEEGARYVVRRHDAETGEEMDIGTLHVERNARGELEGRITADTIDSPL